MDVYRVHAYWGPRLDGPEIGARQLHHLFGRLRAITPLLAAWEFFDDAEQRVQCDTLASCERGVREGKVIFRIGDPEETLTAYDQRFSSGRQDQAIELVELRFVCGIESDMTPLWRMNRLEMVLPRRAPGLGVDEIAAILGAMVDTFAPDWGFAGTARVPELPSMGNGEPAVGWMTYFSERHGPLPIIPAPARVSALGRGALVISLSKPFLDRSQTHLDAVQNVRSALGARVLQNPPLPEGDDLTPPEKPEMTTGATPFVAEPLPELLAYLASRPKPGDLAPDVRAPTLAAPADGEGPTLGLHHYAALCAEIAVAPDHTAAILLRYGLPDDAARVRLNEEWMQSLLQDGEMMRVWVALWTQYRDALTKPKRGP